MHHLGATPARNPRCSLRAAQPTCPARLPLQVALGVPSAAPLMPKGSGSAPRPLRESPRRLRNLCRRCPSGVEPWTAAGIYFRTERGHAVTAAARRMRAVTGTSIAPSTATRMQLESLAAMEDVLLKDRILTAIEWETEVDVATTGVSVAEGLVTLFGCVGTAMERQVLERVVQGVSGVAGITNDLEVHGWRASRCHPRRRASQPHQPARG